MLKLTLRHKTWLLLLAGFLFFIFGLSGWDLTAPDEPRFALVAREMIDTGNYLFPHRNERAYPDKPPLFFWSIAALSPLTGGINEWSARLPSAISALMCLFLIGQWAGMGKWNSKVGIGSMLVLATGIQFMQQAHNAQIDMLLCVLVLGATLLGYRRLQGEDTSQFGIGLLLGLAILAKGPVGYIMPVGTWAVYCLLSGKASWSRFPLKSLLWGLLPPLLWIVGLTIQVWQENAWDYWENLLFKQTVVRYTNAWHHHKPFYYFLQRIITDFFPWSLFLVAAIPWTRKQRQELDPKHRFAWAAILFILVFFSLSSGKRHLYIVPLYPFAAYLVAHFFLNLSKPKLIHRLLLAPGALIFSLMGAALVAIGFNWVELEELEEIGRALPSAGIIIFGTLIFLGGVLTFLNVFRWKKNALPVGILLAIFSLNLLFYQVVAPWLSPQRSARDFTSKVVAITDSLDPIPKLAMVDFRSAYRYFGNQHITELSNLETSESDPKLIGLPSPQDFWQDHPEGVIIIRKRHLEEFESSEAGFPKHEILLDQRVSDDQFLLIAPSGG